MPDTERVILVTGGVQAGGIRHRAERCGGRRHDPGNDLHRGLKTHPARHFRKTLNHKSSMLRMICSITSGSVLGLKKTAFQAGMFTPLGA